MIISRIILKNWKNFQSVDVPLRQRMFLVGPNASGKSNFLDVFRFMKEIAKQGGGLQQAVSDRGGISKIRCLAARREPQIEIEVHLAETFNSKPFWKYGIGIIQETSGHRQPFLKYEKVWKGNELILNRPNPDDERDKLRLTQTHLQQISANAKFREIVKFFESMKYFHLVPQLLRYPESFSGPPMKDDSFGRNFLEMVARTPDKTRKKRLSKIEEALHFAVPYLKQLANTKDLAGLPHLEAVYEHWRPKGARQNEEQFSDGTLRLIAFLWSMLESDSLLLLEEPELSLHPGVVRKLPGLIWRIKSKQKRQIIISTHSYDLLSDLGIGGEETLMLIPQNEGTFVQLASSKSDIKELLEGGLSIADTVIPYTEPKEVNQMDVFDV
ncbi:MAG: AAA family ATPase [bacterium]